MMQRLGSRVIVSSIVRPLFPTASGARIAAAGCVIPL
jgi:hypothetical protein